MNKLTITALLFTILINYNVSSYAINKPAESNNIQSNYFVLEKDYKNEFLLSQNNVYKPYINLNNLSSETKKEISESTWLWSFLYPGLGQILMGAYPLGITFAVSSSIMLIISGLILASIIDINSKNTGFETPTGVFGSFIIFCTTTFAFLVLYIWSIIDAFILNKKEEKSNNLSNSLINDYSKNISEINKNNERAGFNIVKF